jgi:ribosomal protein S18 acetylase RimI-like enzyme
MRADGGRDMNPTIHSVAELLRQGRRELSLYAGAEAVFWETASRTSFTDATELCKYRRMYFDYYWHAAPELFLLAVRDAEATAPGLETLGYVCALADTRAHSELYQLAAHLSLFDDLYEMYPAHLHVNLTGASRGLGLGSRLIAALEERLRRADIQAPGLHLITSTEARNVPFYRRNGFLLAPPAIPVGGGT